MGTKIEVWADISEQFSFLEEQLVYVDAPLEGFVRSFKTGELFVFRSTPIVAELVWHWVLLPIASTDVTVKSAFDAARAMPPEHWLSVIEDRRGEEPRLYAASLASSVHRLPKSVMDE
jgi:hypothetical protein